MDASMNVSVIVNMSIKLQDVQLIVAGPTTGKNALMTCVKSGAFLENDLLVKDVWPNWYQEKWSSPQSRDAAKRQLIERTAPRIRQALKEGKIFLTSDWSRAFADPADSCYLGAQYFIDGKWPIAFWRKNAERVVEISLNREKGRKGFPLSLVRHWLAAARKYLPAACAHVVWLNDDQYLTTEIVSLNGMIVQPFNEDKAI